MKEEASVIRVEAIDTFTLARFDEIADSIVRISLDEYGKVFKRDTFECKSDLAKYLLGENKLQKPFVKIIEIIPGSIAKN